MELHKINLTSVIVTTQPRHDSSSGHHYCALYSRGQAKSANPVSRQGMYLWSQLFQILVLICEISQKTHLRSFSHERLAMPKILDQKTAKSGSKMGRNVPNMIKNLCLCWSSVWKQSESIKKSPHGTYGEDRWCELAIGDLTMMTFLSYVTSCHIKSVCPILVDVQDFFSVRTAW